jgi:hypothetical protein
VQGTYLVYTPFHEKSDDAGTIAWQALANAGIMLAVIAVMTGDHNAVLRIRNVYLGSRILIFTHPGFRISDPGSRIQIQQQKRGIKKNCCHTFLCSHKFHKI